MLADGASYAAITAAVDCYPAYVVRWKQRFEAARLAGLEARSGHLARVRTPAMEARILAKTQQAPPDGSTYCSTRKLAKVLGVNDVLVARVWRRAGLQPHRLEHYMLSDDPDFKQATVIGLYLNPPQHAAVFAADEKTAIQALDRLDRGAAVVAGARRTAWLRGLPARHPVALRGPEHPHGGDSRADRAAAHQPGLRRVLWTTSPRPNRGGGTFM